MAKTDIWMPLYIADYLADTMRLSTEQHGAYLLLIMDYWRNGPLPDDDAALSSITKLPQATWRKYRPILERMFNVSGGEWRHKRIDDELHKAKENSNKNEQRARNAAKQRWSKQSEFSSSSNAPSMPQEVLNECPSHTPSPTPSNSNPVVEHTESLTPDTPPEEPEQACVIPLKPGLAGSYCKIMISKGIRGCTPSNPTLLVLIHAGATEEEFADAARTAVGKGKPEFGYALGIVQKRREDAAKLVLHQGRLPNKQEALEQSNKAATAGWLPPELREMKNAN